MERFLRQFGRELVIGLPYAWLAVFFFLPFLILAYISLVDMGNDIHPFKPLWDSASGVVNLKYENYLSIFRAEGRALAEVGLLGGAEGVEVGGGGQGGAALGDDAVEVGAAGGLVVDAGGGVRGGHAGVSPRRTG